MLNERENVIFITWTRATRTHIFTVWSHWQLRSFFCRFCCCCVWVWWSAPSICARWAHTRIKTCRRATSLGQRDPRNGRFHGVERLEWIVTLNIAIRFGSEIWKMQSNIFFSFWFARRHESNRKKPHKERFEWARADTIIRLFTCARWARFKWPHVDLYVYSVVIVPAHHENQSTEIDLILGSSAVNCFAFLYFCIRFPTEPVIIAAFQPVSMKNGIHFVLAECVNNGDHLIECVAEEAAATETFTDLSHVILLSQLATRKQPFPFSSSFRRLCNWPKTHKTNGKKREDRIEHTWTRKSWQFFCSRLSLVHFVHMFECLEPDLCVVCAWHFRAKGF